MEIKAYVYSMRQLVLCAENHISNPTEPSHNSELKHAGTLEAPARVNNKPLDDVFM